jgi:hypothetical protein
MKATAIILAALCAGCGPNRQVDGIRIHTDELTHCQYIGLYKKAITPRMGADGKQICNAKEK